MFDEKKVKDLVLTSLVADAYSLGAHWVYDENQLINLDVNWDELNDPKAIWHKEKKAGEFTHYGDQTLWLYEYLQGKDKFDSKDYISYWAKKVEVYNGYIDGATRESLENVKNDVSPSGSLSTDLSVIGRITPLLLVSNSKEDFLENVEALIKLTHNSSQALNAGRFFALLLVDVLEGKKILSSIEALKDKFDSSIQGYITKAIESKNSDSFTTIREFGPACDIDGGFAGVIHLLVKYDNLKDMLIANAKAGGDTSSRAMIASSIFMAQSKMNQIPASWLNIKATII